MNPRTAVKSESLRSSVQRSRSDFRAVLGPSPLVREVPSSVRSTPIPGKIRDPSETPFVAPRPVGDRLSADPERLMTAGSLTARRLRSDVHVGRVLQNLYAPAGELFRHEMARRADGVDSHVLHMMAPQFVRESIV